MNVSKLLRFLLSQFFTMGIVESGGGGAAVADDETATDEGDGNESGTSEADNEPGDGADQDGDGEQQDEGSTTDEADELVVTLGDDPAAEADESVIDDEDIGRIEDLTPKAKVGFVKLRQQKTQLKREKERLQRELDALKGAGQGTQPAAVVVGEKPTLKEYADAEEIAQYERDLDSWMERKRQAESQQKEREKAEQDQRAHWQGRLASVDKAASSMKVRNADEATQVFEDTFSIVQQGIILGGLEDPKSSALMRYALGSNPKKAKELAAIADPVKFAIAIGKLEDKVKTAPRKAAPPPDKPLRSSVAGASVVSGELARLEAEADRTGDRSKVVAFKRQQKAKSAA